MWSKKSRGHQPDVVEENYLNDCANTEQICMAYYKLLAPTLNDVIMPLSLLGCK